MTTPESSAESAIGAAFGILVIAAIIAFVVLQGCAEKPEERQAKACKAIGAEKSYSAVSGDVCVIKRGTSTGEIKLTDDGPIDRDDLDDERAYCVEQEADSLREVREQATYKLLAKRQSHRWVEPGICEERTVLFSIAERRRLRRVYFITKARQETPSEPRKGLRYAKKAHALEANSTTRTLIVRARRRIRTLAASQAAARAEDALNATRYAGQNCDEIGHSFSVVPGSDPVHDSNNDGEACEYQ